MYVSLPLFSSLGRARPFLQLRTLQIPMASAKCSPYLGEQGGEILTVRSCSWLTEGKASSLERWNKPGLVCLALGCGCPEPAALERLEWLFLSCCWWWSWKDKPRGMCFLWLQNSEPALCPEITTGKCCAQPECVLSHWGLSLEMGRDWNSQPLLIPTNAAKIPPGEWQGLP